MCVHLTIVYQYHRDRQSADTSEEKRRAWRTYAKAVIEQRIANGSGGDLPWRRSAGDDELPVRFPPYWNAISVHDLHQLWLALERARHRVTHD